MTSIKIVSNNRLYSFCLERIAEEKDWRHRVETEQTVSTLQKCAHTGPDLVVVGIENSEEVHSLLYPIQKLHPKTPIAILVGDEGLIDELKPLPSQFKAIMTPFQDAERIGTILELVLDGISVMPSSMSGATGPRSSIIAKRLGLGRNLTRREKEILQILTEGQTNKEIGRKLDISSNTVEVHVSSIIKKLNVRNRTEAAMVAAADLG